MSPIIMQPGPPAHAHPDEAARKRAERLARATPGQAEAALAYLSAIDPVMFGIAMDAADQAAGETPEDDEAIPVCRQCDGLAGIFLDHGLRCPTVPGQVTCCVVHGPSGFAVTPRMCTYREPTSITKKQYRRCRVTAQST
jgi:hypothetical protein